MDLELLYDRAQLVGHADLNGLVPSTAALVLRRADGTQLQAPAVSLPTAATTVAAGTTTTALPHQPDGRGRPARSHRAPEETDRHGVVLGGTVHPGGGDVTAAGGGRSGACLGLGNPRIDGHQ